MLPDASLQPDASLLRSATAFRRALHAAPETAHHESATAKRVEEFLREQGLRPWLRNVGGHGLVYRIQGSSRRTLLFRAELDALPIHEETRRAHASRLPGNHHACGHDGHMAMLAAALAQLAHGPRPASSVLAVFQPAEETGEGAARLVAPLASKVGVVDGAFAIHNFPGLPSGTVGVRNGTAAKPSMGLEITMKGRRTHASEPQHGRTPLPALARLVQKVQPHAVAPHRSRSAFATLIGLNSGPNNFGVSPGEATLALTLRGDTQPRLDRLERTIVEAARRVARSEQLRVRLQSRDVFRETRNHPAAVREARRAAARAGLPVKTLEEPLSASEDFGRFTERWPGALILLGAGERHAPLHHARYDFPDPLLGAGIRFWLALARAPTPRTLDAARRNRLMGESQSPVPWAGMARSS
jgi:amidohydrolase